MFLDRRAAKKHLKERRCHFLVAMHRILIPEERGKLSKKQNVD